jgi:hypothetical protein
MPCVSTTLGVNKLPTVRHIGVAVHIVLDNDVCEQARLPSVA